VLSSCSEIKKERAKNCMMQLMVENLDTWWEHIKAQEFAERVWRSIAKGPDYEAVHVGFVYDPSGVL
jgi:hypothetical protein